jgi:hypothetical protein
MFPVCPKCRHHLAAPSGATACPACGLVFAKFVAAQSGAPLRALPGELRADPVDDDGGTGIAARLLWVPERVEAWQVYARAVLFGLLTLWGWRLAAMDIRTGEMGGSFIHLPHLVFHEAGHVIFMAFGELMHLAGGTIGQLAVPIILGVALHMKNRDNFGASIALWWLATSFMDCAPYAYDAHDPRLMLLTGRTGEDGPHDWIDMLGILGIGQHARAIGHALHSIGVALMLAANVWGGYILWRQYRNRTEGATLD